MNAAKAKSTSLPFLQELAERGVGDRALPRWLREEPVDGKHSGNVILAETNALRPLSQMGERYHPRLLRGEPVPKEFAMGFLALGIDLGLTNVASFSDHFDLVTIPDEGVYGPIGLSKLRDYLLRNLDSAQQGFVQAKEIDELVDVSLEFAGRHMNDKIDSTTDAIDYCLTIMKGRRDKFSRDDYANWIRKWHEVDERLVMGANTGGKSKKSGMNVVIPVKPASFELLRQGLKDEFQLTADDVMLPTQHFHFHMYSQRHGLQLRQKANLGFRQAAQMLYQVGFMAKDVAKYPPKVLLISEIPQNARRAEEYGGVPLPDVMPLTGVKLMEWDLSSRNAKSRMMLGMIQWFQGYFKEDRQAAYGIEG